MSVAVNWNGFWPQPDATGGLAHHAVLSTADVNYALSLE
jgi:hypothetical protein